MREFLEAIGWVLSTTFGIELGKYALGDFFAFVIVAAGAIVIGSFLFSIFRDNYEFAEERTKRRYLVSLVLVSSVIFFVLAAVFNSFEE